MSTQQTFFAGLSTYQILLRVLGYSLMVVIPGWLGTNRRRRITSEQRLRDELVFGDDDAKELDGDDGKP